MPEPSFDVVSEVNLPEVANAVQQAQKELAQRYDLKGTAAAIAQNEKELVLTADHDFGLKAVARAMKAHGLIATEWGEGLADGTGAMAGAWAAADLAAKDGGDLGTIELMRDVARYNEIDCRVMAEVLDHLRREH